MLNFSGGWEGGFVGKGKEEGESEGSMNCDSPMKVLGGVGGRVGSGNCGRMTCKHRSKEETVEVVEGPHSYKRVQLRELCLRESISNWLDRTPDQIVSISNVRMYYINDTWKRADCAQSLFYFVKRNKRNI